MNRRYAEDTTVPVERTQAEITALLAKHGASSRAVGVDDSTGRAFVMFALGGRQIRVEVTMPAPTPLELPRGSLKWTSAERQSWARERHHQRGRALWRGLLLLLKAKLEAVEGGYTTVEREFLADVLLPGGRCVGQLVADSVKSAYLTGSLPPLLPRAASE